MKELYATPGIIKYNSTYKVTKGDIKHFEG
jgi:hypothetical protein